MVISRSLYGFPSGLDRGFLAGLPAYPLDGRPALDMPGPVWNFFAHNLFCSASQCTLREKVRPVSAGSAWLFLLGGIISGLIPALWAYLYLKRREGPADAPLRRNLQHR